MAKQTWLLNIPKTATPLRAVRIYQQNISWLNSFNWNKWDDTFPAANESDVRFEIEADFLKWAARYTPRKRTPTKRKKSTKRSKRK